MNRLEEDRVAAINLAFYKNVSLLRQVVPASFEFQQHFKKNMFDKANTAGFLHVSHYLSIICDAKLFKQMVKWPLFCKKDEATYRVEIKNFFSILSRENSDIKFPSILMSHLIQSSGTKFLTFMWKLSQLALRIFLKGELQGELLDAPHSGPMNDLSMMYLKNTNIELCCSIASTRKETARIPDAVNSFVNDEIKILNMYKSEIFERKKNIKELVANMSVHPLSRKQLMDIEDSSIIDLWKMQTSKKLQFLHKENKELNEFEESCKYLCKIILSIKSNSEILDANEFPKLSCDHYFLRSQFYTQDGFFKFSTLLSLLRAVLMRMPYHININFSDVSSCSLCIQNICEIIKTLQTLFIGLNMKVNSMLNDEQRVSRNPEDVCTIFNPDNLPITNQDIFLQSPKIKFNFNQNTDDDLFHKELCSSLTEGKHKHLFKRYKRRYCPYELPTTVFDLTNSWSNMSGWLSPRAYSNKYIFNRKPLSPIYSRLLHNSKLKSKRSKEDTYNSSVRYEALNLTPRKHHSTSKQLTMKSHARQTKNLFNSIVPSSPSRAFSDMKN